MLGKMIRRAHEAVTRQPASRTQIGRERTLVFEGERPKERLHVQRSSVSQQLVLLRGRGG